MKLKDTASALRLKCPGGTRYHEGACIEKGQRSARPWPDALAACSAAGRRLPDRAELMGFAREPGIAVGPAPDAEWASEVESAPPDVNAAAVFEVGVDVFTSTDPVTDSHLFRCVANARR